MRPVFFLAMMLGVTLCSGGQAPPPEKAVAEEEVQIPMHPMAPAVPKYVVFAGDTVRFDRPDLYERMDRELIAFTYSHTLSTLIIKRSERYFSIVVPILKEQGIPEDLKYLMAIESNLDPHALSKSGAAGLWQFMKPAAQQYGLEVGKEVDERYHIEKETVAACKYLKDSYKRYKDWMTVAASYNAGQGGVSKRLREQSEGSAMDLLLPDETSRYMFRILAAKMLLENPAAFGYGQLERYPVLKGGRSYTLNGSIPSLYKFAKDRGVSYFALKEANLWLRDTLLTNKAGKSYSIAIP
ncbi:MAG: lytic transglycosylase domain-containing protein [Bacteroidales bacterium]|nr:lytic transglycosylase domain-containing protein [Bacteroidales bacterium]